MQLHRARHLRGIEPHGSRLGVSRRLGHTKMSNRRLKRALKSCALGGMCMEASGWKSGKANFDTAAGISLDYLGTYLLANPGTLGLSWAQGGGSRNLHLGSQVNESRELRILAILSNASEAAQ